MAGRLQVALFVVALAAATGTVTAVSIDGHPQPIRLSDHDVTGGKEFSIDDRTTVYAGTAVDGYDVTLRNSGSVQLSANVTVSLRTLEGTLVADASDSGTVLTGSTATVQLRFAAPVDTGTFDQVEVVADTS